MGLICTLFDVISRQFINQAVSVFDGVHVNVQIKERFELNGSLFLLKVGEYAFKYIWTIIGTHIDSDWDIFNVGKKTVALDNAHLSVLILLSGNQI